MNRRGFLGTLLASVPAIALSQDFLLWKPTEGLDLVAPDALIGLRAITEYMAREMAKRVPGRVLPEEGLRLNDAGLKHQLGVDMMMFPDRIGIGGLDAKRYLEPTIANLSDRLRRFGSSTYGKLELPRGCEQAYRVDLPQFSIRSVYDYVLGPDYQGYLLRFDVLA